MLQCTSYTPYNVGEKNPTIRQHPYKQALGDRGKEELSFNRKILPVVLIHEDGGSTGLITTKICAYEFAECLCNKTSRPEAFWFQFVVHFLLGGVGGERKLKTPKMLKAPLKTSFHNVENKRRAEFLEIHKDLSLLIRINNGFHDCLGLLQCK